jgi:hypothetical protein
MSVGACSLRHRYVPFPPPLDRTVMQEVGWFWKEAEVPPYKVRAHAMGGGGGVGAGCRCATASDVCPRDTPCWAISPTRGLCAHGTGRMAHGLHAPPRMLKRRALPAGGCA